MDCASPLVRDEGAAFVAGGGALGRQGRLAQEPSHRPGSGRRIGKEALMARHLKRGMDAGAIKAADAHVRQTVEQILSEVEAGGDAAVRALSERFDKWSPASFKLSDSEVERAMGAVAKRDL